MTDRPHIHLVQRYYDACNRADEVELRTFFTPDAIHYFTGRGPTVGADKVIGYCLAAVRQVEARWTVDHALAGGDEVVVEWTMSWRPPSRNEVTLTRGTEWMIIRDGRIAEVRAYFQRDPENRATELQGFPYRERGYTMVP